MKLTVAELHIIIDTLIGSTSLHDGGTFFRYKKEARETLVKSLIERASNIEIDIKPEEGE